MICPKCDYQRKTTDVAPEWQCPSCGVAYAKAIAVERRLSAAAVAKATQEEEDALPPGQTLVVLLIVVGIIPWALCVVWYIVPLIGQITGSVSLGVYLVLILLPPSLLLRLVLK